MCRRGGPRQLVQPIPRRFDALASKETLPVLGRRNTTVGRFGPSPYGTSQTPARRASSSERVRPVGIEDLDRRPSTGLAPQAEPNRVETKEGRRGQGRTPLKVMQSSHATPPS